MTAASEITRQAKSNLAFALRALPKARRDDAVVFYAFCRTVDDLADAPGLSPAQRRAALEAWHTGITHGFASPDPFQRDFSDLRERLDLPTDQLCAIVEGCMMDIEPRLYPTWEDLDGYVWKVACTTGLVSIRVFGCTDPGAPAYATALGRALQLTNILRDVGEDFRNGRIYLPLELLDRHGLSPAALPPPPGDPHFAAVANEMASRAEDHFSQAAALLPAADHATLLPARVMADIYQTLLRRMRSGGFRVFEKRHRLGATAKLTILAKHLVAQTPPLE